MRRNKEILDFYKNVKVKVKVNANQNQVDWLEFWLEFPGFSTFWTFGPCSELVDYTRSYLQTGKFGLHFGLDYDLW